MVNKITGPWIVKHAKDWDLELTLNSLHQNGIAFDPKQILVNYAADRTTVFTIIGFDTTWKPEPTEPAKECRAYGCPHEAASGEEYCAMHIDFIQEASRAE